MNMLSISALALLAAAPVAAADLRTDGINPALDVQGGTFQEMISGDSKDDLSDSGTYIGGLAREMSAADLLGKRIYTLQGGDAEPSVFDLNDGWEDVGEVADILLTPAGDVASVQLDLGGFLGFGETEVTVSMNQLQFLTEDPAAGSDVDDFFVVLSKDTVDQLTEDAS